MKAPKKPKFPRKPKSKSVDALERWARKCEEIRTEYNKKYSEWKKHDNRIKALTSKGMKAKELKR
ncbi:hypothetical protein P3G55_20075 [Leptospira sp. 96542]|nr:hypothetical protein [Leptospira sp. 96542]